MALITNSDLETRYGAAEISDLADRDGDGAADPGVIDGAIADAEAEVLALIGPALTGPLPSQVPDVLKQATAVIARYNLWRRDTGPDHPAYIAYKDTLKLLSGVASGAVELPLEDGSNAADVAGLAAWAPPTVFSDDALSAMLPEPRK